jgi:hypothetical protein
VLPLTRLRVYVMIKLNTAWDVDRLILLAVLARVNAINMLFI